ncbi:type II secretion system GspH family protein [bacterium]|nr:type II secretion system GspH family protein [bacterium]MBU1884285.1 type II secretion system GspH family protein [bacterium]
MKNFKSAFTMIELVFVIVVLGILASIALPKFIATRTDAVIAKGRSDVASIRTAISTERQKRFMQGDSSYINHLDANVTVNTIGVTVFDDNGTATNRLLTYGITTKDADGGWVKLDIDKYVYRVKQNLWIPFYYDATEGTFNCDATAGTAIEQDYCAKLTK